MEYETRCLEGTKVKSQKNSHEFYRILPNISDFLPSFAKFFKRSKWSLFSGVKKKNTSDIQDRFLT